MPDSGNSAPDDRLSSIALLRSMMMIRAFEKSLMSLPKPGFQLLSAGEEAVAVGVCAGLAPDDSLLCSGRSIGPALARGLSPSAVMAEVLGKAAGPCQGRGGRSHIAEPAGGFFGAHGVVGGNLSVAAGVALAAQMQRTGRIVACLFGDGACGAGALHETLNLAALWQLPLVLICCNNQYSVSTPVRQALKPLQLSELAQPFGVPAQTIDGMDVLQVREAMRVMAGRARAGDGPSFLECIAYRFSAHSTWSRESRPADEVRHWQEHCPIRLLADQLRAANRISATDLAHLQEEVDEEAAAASRFAVAAPYPEPAEGFEF